MKTTFALLLAAVTGVFCSCGSGSPLPLHMEVKNVITKVDSMAYPPMIGPGPKTGLFTLWIKDSVSDYLVFKTEQGTLRLPNNRRKISLVGRYDMEKNFIITGKDTAFRLLWIGIGYSTGDVSPSTYRLSQDEDAVYVAGCFSGTVSFSFAPGDTKVLTYENAGGTDMFVSRYTYKQGFLAWTNTGGSTHNDLGFPYTNKQGVSEYGSVSSMDAENIHPKPDSMIPLLHVWTKSSGPELRFANGPGSADDKSLRLDTASYVEVTFNRLTSIVTDIQKVSSIPRH
jgi:hypothetical protein